MHVHERQDRFLRTGQVTPSARATALLSSRWTDLPFPTRIHPFCNGWESSPLRSSWSLSRLVGLVFGIRGRAGHECCERHIHILIFLLALPYPFLSHPGVCWPLRSYSQNAPSPPFATSISTSHRFLGRDLELLLYHGCTPGHSVYHRSCATSTRSHQIVSRS